jgi:hypothetical protein
MTDFFNGNTIFPLLLRERIHGRLLDEVMLSSF